MVARFFLPWSLGPEKEPPVMGLKPLSPKGVVPMEMDGAVVMLTVNR